MTARFRLLILLMLPLVFLLMPLHADAHKIRIFAWPEGTTIHGETAFSGSRKPVNVEVMVLDAATKRTLLTTRTDTQGKFNFQLPTEAIGKRLDLLLVVNTGEGHRGEWPLPAVEYLDSVDQPIPENTSASAPAPVHVEPAILPTSTNNTDLNDAQHLRRIIDEELEKKLAPIRQLLAEQNDRSPTLADIFAGLGYIFGLAGLLIWLQNRKKRSTAQ